MPGKAFDGALPAHIMEKLTVEQRFKARFYDAQAEIEANLPRNYRQAVSYLTRLHLAAIISETPGTPYEGQRWMDSTTGEVKEWKDGQVRVVRKR